jgi:hypothetical protein
MRSIISQGLTPFTVPDSCSIGSRTEVKFTLRKNGRLYKFVARDKLRPEDPYFVMVKAAAFAVRNGEPYNGKTPSRALKDFLVKSTLVI